MIEFVNLQVSNGRLSGTIRVKSDSCYENVYIEEVYVGTQDTFSETSPYSNSVWSETLSSQQKEYSLDLVVTDFPSEANIDMSKTLFFVTAKATGTPSPDTPCGCDNIYSTGATFDLCPIYNETMAYVKEIDNTCVLPRNFINMILQLKAIQYSINSGHYTQAAEYYKKFYKNLSVGTKPCNCNG